MTNATAYGIIIAFLIGMAVLFHVHQSLMAYAMLQGFWYIGTQDDTDHYMLLDEKTIQIIGTHGDVSVVLFQGEADVSFYPGITLGQFSFGFKTKQDIPILDIDKSQNVRIELYASCGILDIGTCDSKSRLVKDNSMSIAYQAA